jgi:ABC-type Mn2+/Zn2+ transport system ATPase subunit
VDLEELIGKLDAALSDLSFIEDTNTVLVLGNTGAGKSTLVNYFLR